MLYVIIKFVQKVPFKFIKETALFCFKFKKTCLRAALTYNNLFVWKLNLETSNSLMLSINIRLGKTSCCTIHSLQAISYSELNCSAWTVTQSILHFQTEMSIFMLSCIEHIKVYKTLLLATKLYQVRLDLPRQKL